MLENVLILASERWAEEGGMRIAASLREAAAERATVSLALAGGSTPAPLYRWLARAGQVPWRRVEIFFTDERCVPPGDPASNHRMARETLLDPAGVDPARVHRMEGERADVGAAADAYAALLPDPLDLVLLGVGEDGHTASLFPRSEALRERRRVVPARAPAVPVARLTVTPPVLERALEVFVLVRGEAKADAVARALEGPWQPDLCPAQLVRERVWLVDEAAASRLGARGVRG